MTTVKELQVKPLLGEFRIHAALKRLGIFLSPRTCGRILALNRKLYTAEELHRIFYSTRPKRVLDRAGYVRFRRWRVYAERGQGGEPVAVWLYAEHLMLVYRDEPLAQYRVTYQPDQNRLQTVAPEHLFETPHRSLQRPLWAWSDDEWLPALRLPAYAPRQPRPTGATQPPLFSVEEVGA
jgi:hypothetical protein